MPLISQAGRPLTGVLQVPGDKSISHRALMFAASAVGTSTITGLLEGEDVLNTAAALQALGATITRLADGSWQIKGVGVGGWQQPNEVLQMGNSGTTTRLLLGLLASTPIQAMFMGDASLSRRPMGRVITPLAQMGAQFTAVDNKLPLTLQGTATAMPITYTLPVASAQVKSAILLAGLNTPGMTTVIEPMATRDHSERMLQAFGAHLTTEKMLAGMQISIQGEVELMATDVQVPGDISSAAFPIVAALLCPGSDLTLPNIGLNPLRTGILTTLLEMGADITVSNERLAGSEPVGDLRVRCSELKGVTVPPERAPSMIDEYPVLAVASAFATGRTVMLGLHELRVKESDRLAAIADGLKACGAHVEVTGDDLTVLESNSIAGGTTIKTQLDHRLAMSFLVLGLASREPVIIDDGSPINTSFPNFVGLMNGVGAAIHAV